MKWELIKNAPKDGTTMDLWVGGRRVIDCFWYAPLNTHKGEGWMTEHDCWLQSLTDDEPDYFLIITAPGVDDLKD